MENQNIQNKPAPLKTTKESEGDLVLDTEGGVMPDPSRLTKEKAQNAAEVFEDQQSKVQPDRERKREPEKKAS